MVIKKNRISVIIEDCADCKFHCGKVIDGRTFMFCQKDRNCIMLREGIGTNAVPDWCPRLINHVAKSTKSIPAKFNAALAEALKDRYGREAVTQRKLEELQAKLTYGDIMTVDQFIELVEEGSIIDDDGCGAFADWGANKHDPVWCDVEWLQKYRGNYPFVIWYNR